VDELTSLLVDSDLSNFDPVYEAFRIYDPKNEGCLSKGGLRKVFEALDMPLVSDDDLDTLFYVADVDKDGRVGLEDFRALLNGVDSRTDEDGPAV
jgi:Ca2+-binding EF-hand superfamily protein